MRHFSEETNNKLFKNEVKICKTLQQLKRTKRLDLLVESNGQTIHMELNTSWGEETIVRNNCFFFFYSQFTKVGERFDAITKFIHISLTYNIRSTINWMNNYDASSDRKTSSYL